jgi:hypothetical protein
MFVDPFLFGGGGGFPADLGIFVSSALVLAVIAILLSGGGEDRARVRPAARYLGVIGLFTLFVSLFASFGAVHAMTDLIVDHQARFDEYSAVYEDEFAPIEGEGTFFPLGYNLYEFSTQAENDGNYAVAVASGLVAITTGLIFGFHARARRRLMEGPNGGSDPAVRIDRAYHASRCGIAALVAGVALTSAGFGIFEIIAPGIALGPGAKITRAEGISEALSFGLLAAAALLIFVRSWNKISPELGFAKNRK